MEGSGVRAALEKLYAPVTMGHMMTGKAYLQALGTLFFNIFPTFHLDGKILDKFRTRRTYTRRNIFDSEDPSINQNHEISTKLVESHENKKN